MQFEVRDYRKESVAEGLKFTTPVFESLDEAAAKLGTGAVLDIINSDVSNTVGLAARKRAGFGSIASAQPSEKPAKLADLLAKIANTFSDGLIFTQEDAANWKPAVRELSLGSLAKKLNEAYLKGAAGVEDFNRIMAQMQAAQAEQLARAAAQG